MTTHENEVKYKNKKRNEFYNEYIQISLIALAGYIAMTKFCSATSPNKIQQKITTSNYKQDEVGFIKNGINTIPYIKINLGLLETKYYDYQSKECLGYYDCIDKIKEPNCLKNSEDEPCLYEPAQVIPYQSIIEDGIGFDYDTLQTFTQETYDNLENTFLEEYKFSKKYISLYQVLNITTNESNYIIGKKLDNSKVFNYESYCVEDYTGYAIYEEKINFDKEEYAYSEILDLLNSYRSENYTRNLK